jgi:SNF2 family DNA or RNA helicase
MARTLEEDPTSKFIVFTLFSEAVAMLREILGENGYSSVSISGHNNAAQRQKSVTTFSTEPQCKCMVLTMGAGAVGLTLTAANTVYMMEPSHQMADEAQALNRCHRIGQTRPVRSLILFCRGTVEERMLAVRREGEQFIQFRESEALSVVRGGHVSG